MCTRRTQERERTPWAVGGCRNVGVCVCCVCVCGVAGQEGEPIPIGGRRGLDGSLTDTAGCDDDSRGDDLHGQKERGTRVFEKYNPLLHSGVLDALEKKQGSSARIKAPEIVSSDFLKKYVEYCKSAVQPILTEKACELIANAYTRLRQKSGQHTIPVTARQLETLIRLSSAHAKVRLSDSVEEIDVDTAHKLLCFALYHDSEGEEPDDEGSDAEADLEDEDVHGGRRLGKRKGDSTSTSGSGRPSPRKTKQARHESAEDGKSAASRMDSFKKVLSNCGADDGIHIDQIVKAYEPHSSHQGDLAAVRVEAEGMLRILEKTDAVMGDEDKVTWYLI